MQLMRFIHVFLLNIFSFTLACVKFIKVTHLYGTIYTSQYHETHYHMFLYIIYMNDFYQRKANKYKYKYLKLKNQLEGGMFKTLLKSGLHPVFHLVFRNLI